MEDVGILYVHSEYFMYGCLVYFVAIGLILWLEGIFFTVLYVVPRKIWQPCSWGRQKIGIGQQAHCWTFPSLVIRETRSQSYVPSYDARVVKIYNTSSILLRFEIQNIFFYFENALCSLLQNRRFSTHCAILMLFETYRSIPHFRLLFQLFRLCIIFGKNVLGYILSDFFSDSSGNPAT
jgi:hypothetical protein